MKSPAATREVEQLGNLIQKLETTIRTVRAELEEMTGNRGADPIKQMADKLGAHSVA